MRNLRCWLFGHEWIATFVQTTGEIDRTRIATCPRCGMSTGFVGDDEGGDDA